MVRCYQVIKGDPIVNVTGWPHVVLEDSDELVAVYMPEGTRLWRWNILEQRFREPRISQGDSVRLFFPGKAYEVSLFYETGSGPAPRVQQLFPDVTGRFYGWKIDLTSPFARTEVGLDMIDETLDIMVSPDRTVTWKNEDRMSLFVELGIYSAAEAEQIRLVGHEVIHARPLPDDGLIPKSVHPFGCLLCLLLSLDTVCVSRCQIVAIFAPIGDVVKHILQIFHGIFSKNRQFSAEAERERVPLATRGACKQVACRHHHYRSFHGRISASARTLPTLPGRRLRLFGHTHSRYFN